MIKPQEINEDGLPVLNWKENEDGLPVMEQPQKKKDGGNWYDNGGTNGNGVGRLGGNVQKNSIGSAAINKVQIESPSEYISKFEEKTGYKPLSLGSDLPQIAKRREEKKYLQYQSIDEYEINPVKLGVASGTISPKELKALYEKPYGKKVVADIINSELPGLEINDLEPSAMRPNEDKFGEIAKELQVKNRQQGIDAQNQSEFNLDNELSNTLSGSTYGADRVGVRGGGEAFAERKENDFGNINTSSASELSDALRKIGGSTKVWDAEGKEINKKELSKKINNRIFQLKAGEDIHPEIAQESELISSVVDAMPVEYKRQGGSANNERDAEYIMSGLNFIRDTRPGEYKAIMSTMKVTGKMPETTYTELANIGRDVKFYKDFKSGEYVEQDDRSFITPQLKKANLAGWLSEDLARKGFRNRFAFTQKEILESYKNAPDELKDDELVADIIKAERAPSFGFIPIPQGEGIAKKGVLNSAMRGMATPIGDILNSVDVGFTASYKSPFDAYLKSKELDRGNQTIINKKGDFTKTLDDNFWNKGVEGFFNLMTQAAIARGIGNVTKLPLNAAIGRIDPRAAITANQAALSIGTPLSTMAQTFGGEYMDFLEKTGSPTKATFGALVSGLAQGQIERFVMPDVKLVDDLNLLTARRNFAKEIINVIDNGGGRKGVADIVKDYVGNVTKIIGKEAWLEEGSQNFANYLTEQIISPETAQDRDLLKETIDTGLAATAQMGLFSLLGAAGQTKVQQSLGKAQLKSIAINADQFIDALGNQLAKGEISQSDYDLSTQIINKHREYNLNTPKRDANGELISPERQLEYAYQSTVADIAEQQASKISDKIQREPFEKKIAEADKIRRQIFYGEEIKDLPKKEEDIQPDGISDQQLFDSVLSKADKGYKATLSVAENAQDGLDYIEDKFAENPVKFREDFGDEIADQILERTSTDKLKSSIDYLIDRNPDDPAIPVLDKLIAQREQQENPPIDQKREMADENTVGEPESPSSSNTPKEETGSVGVVDFENAKEGDVVLYFGEKVTVGGKEKTNSGKDGIQLKNSQGGYWVIDKESWAKDIKAVEQSLKAQTPSPKEEAGSVGVGEVLRKNGFVESKNGGLEKDGIRIVVSEGAALGLDQSGDVINVISSNPKDIVLKEINVVDEAARGKGNATQVLRDFLAAADEAGNTIFIEPSPIAKFKNKDNLTEQQLINWYERHGFEKMNDQVWRRKPNAKLNENDTNSDYENRLTYEEADRYRESIKKGEITATEAKKGIEQNGFIVPKDIAEQSLKETTKAETPTQEGNAEKVAKLESERDMAILREKADIGELEFIAEDALPKEEVVTKRQGVEFTTEKPNEKLRLQQKEISDKFDKLKDLLGCLTGKKGK